MCQAERMASGAEGSRTLDLLNAMRNTGDATVLYRAQVGRKSRPPSLPRSASRTVACRLTVPEPSQVGRASHFRAVIPLDPAAQLEAGGPRHGPPGPGHDAPPETSFTSAAASASRGRIWSASPAATAAPGMPNTTDVSSSWATVRPPASLTARSPATPSCPIPLRMTATVPDPKARATDSKRNVAEGRKPPTGGALESAIVPQSETPRWRSSGARYTGRGTEPAPA